ncbi:TlyA family RNA methyltransferase [Leucobacter chromiiresistens]|uniref:23S rRNA (Cytidine1920-2'-O)/16S rRNA (Cytidine1409-2'-O)-methyltransferase n=1 Tax=Leucobacter chromiiresistens TaxID=1079994 RepID=A0A1H0Z0G4_9MICO|nr:TlyA family RNA methyltransferase [Leucobacter chromiiresistens]SDQ21017.1 23S rRNA (cytidine1920-2'-O)/16S rRNA (cytidine1409-2'-O)-methyltransferase [Leucobacter chromiiresistens]
MAGRDPRADGPGVARLPHAAGLPHAERRAVWAGDAERLDRVLPQLGLARSRSRAAELIGAGRVSVNGAAAPKPGVRVASGDLVTVADDDHYVGRAAHKLLAALEEFGVDPAGRIALDLGASTGGFTQVLLERGARAVLAIDVGHDQLAAELRDDPRVKLVEGRNARELTPANLVADTGVTEPPTLVVADLSFISLRLVLPAIAACAAPDAQLVLLIKPQFEVGRVKDGVVTAPEQWRDAVLGVQRAAEEHGFALSGLAASPVTGAHGNREFLGGFVRAGEAVPTEWESRIAELTGAREARATTDRARVDEGR